MGSLIEINDTLKLTIEEGLPREPRLGGTYNFHKTERRLYHLKPTRVFLVEDRQGKWNFIGHAEISELTIDAEKNETRGTFIITQIYDRDYAAQLNAREAPKGKGLIG
ncbi:MAG TPA: hypothetical protein VFR09_01925 [Alphaproteobacteria bacterium]|nr:hypothetical protein [Alphaproteobacteria bacterium]